MLWSQPKNVKREGMVTAFSKYLFTKALVNKDQNHNLERKKNKNKNYLFIKL